MVEFDKGYWERHWEPAATSGDGAHAVNPYVVAETSGLPTGTALDAGCGIGTEALWLTEHGWEVTAADISTAALETARARSGADGIEWLETDVSHWEPGRDWDLVITNYAHPQIGQLPFYSKLSSWVAPGGTLLIVGHGSARTHRAQQAHTTHAHSHPEAATAALADITDLFDDPAWTIESGFEHTRTVHPDGSPVQLHDVVVRVRRSV